MDKEAKIRMARISDIPQLIDLNQKWLKKNLPDLRNGFVGAAFPSAVFEKVINEGQIVVGEYQNNLCGYYLINNFSKEGVLALHEAKVIELQKRKILDPKCTIGFGGQVIIDTNFQGAGLRTAMLLEISKLLVNKYNYSFRTIAKENTRACKAHTKDGWRVYDEDQDYYYVAIDIRETRINPNY